MGGAAITGDLVGGRSQRPWAWLALLAASVGMYGRVALAAATRGSNDIVTWGIFARKITVDGLLQMYDLPYWAGWNHPPLAGLSSSLAWRLSQMSGLLFPFVLKLIPILADGVVLVLLWRLLLPRGDRTAALSVMAFALSPGALLVSAYHGNFDPLQACLVLASAFAATRERPALAGLALGGAIAVKFIPVILAPVLLLHFRRDRERLSALIGLIFGALPIFWVFAFRPSGFLSNVVEYRPMLENWGIVFFARLAERVPPTQFLLPGSLPAIEQMGTVAIMLCASGVALWVARGLQAPIYATYAVILAAFLIFVPGFGVQWTALLGPILTANSWRWGAAWGLLSGIFIASVYLHFWTGTRYAFSWFNTAFPFNDALLGLAAWGLLVAFAVMSVVAWRRGAMELA